MAVPLLGSSNSMRGIESTSKPSFPPNPSDPFVSLSVSTSHPQSPYPSFNMAYPPPDKAMQRLMSELPATIWILLASGVVYLLFQVIARRPSLPRGTPTLIKPGAGDWPVLGSLRYFSDRQRFMLSRIAESITGNFSFYFGKHHIVGLGGPEGKKTFFESKHLDFAQGCVQLLLPLQLL